MIGNKVNNIAIVYTLWSNLKKTADMEVGQVGFHSNKEVMKKIASYKGVFVTLILSMQLM